MNEIEINLHNLVDNAPFMQQFSLCLQSAQPDSICMTAPVRPEICNNYHMVHGGFLLHMADTAAGLAALTDGRRYVTQSCSVQFLRNVGEGTLTIKGVVLHRGHTVTISRVEIFDDADTLLCECLFTMFAVEMPIEPM